MKLNKMIKLMIGRIKEEHAEKFFNDLNDYNDYYDDINNYVFILLNDDDVYILENELINVKRENIKIKFETLNYIYNYGTLYGLDELKFYDLIEIMK